MFTNNVCIFLQDDNNNNNNNNNNKKSDAALSDALSDESFEIIKLLVEEGAAKVHFTAADLPSK